MPASEVMSLYRQHKLHSGPGGPVVKKKKQAVAIQISMARKEGHKIPAVKGSFQQGGLVPETGNYQVHRGEEIMPFAKRVPLSYPISPNIEDRRGDPHASIGSIVPRDEFMMRDSQAQDIAARTGAAEQGEWRAAMHERRAPYDMMGGPAPSGSAHYAVEGLKGNIAQQMHEQGERAVGGGGYSSVRPRDLPMSRRGVLGSYDQGGEVKQTGDYQAHAGEELVPSGFYSGATSQNFSYPINDSAPGAAPDLGIAPPGMPPSLTGKPQQPPKKAEDPRRSHEEWRGMAANVNAPLARYESFKRGGTIPRTGIYRLHEGEHVIPANLAKRYREMKAHG